MRHGIFPQLCLFTSTTLLLTFSLGCASGSSVSVAPLDPATPAKAPSFSGTVHGGQQPVIGATIQLYTAGTPTSGGGYGQGAVGLIAAPLPVTDLNGSFTITGDYTLPSAGSHVYIVATGGTAGVGLPLNNGIALMAVMDSCTPTTAFSPSMHVTINEVTTMAAVMALQPFMAAPASGNSGAPSIGAPATAYNSLQNAFETANNLANINTGIAVPALNNYATSSANALLVNSLADSIAYCVNSNITSGNCGTLFSDVTPSTSTFVATDTIQAAWYIAQNPTNNVAAIFNLGSPSPPFIGLPTAPSDFTYTVATSASACQVPVPLGYAGNYAILGGASVTNTSTGSDQTVITNGDVGVSPGTALTGFVTGTYVATIDNSDAGAAESDLGTAYQTAAALKFPAVLPGDLSNLTFTPGLYETGSAVTLNSGAVTLDGQGDTNATFVFQIGTSFITAAGTQVILINGANASNVFWQVGSSATIGANSALAGNFMALTTITFGTDATLLGRAMASNGSVTLESNKITAP